MPKVRRFSGRLKVELSFNDRSDVYQARVCPVDPPKWKGRSQVACQKVTVGLPGGRYPKGGVDSAKAFDDAARAAISFSRDDLQEFADHTGSTWRISRGGRRRYVKGHPKRRS